jgi:endonuclease/exonuclease/phosphatase (EEP) superfamily protein YafD
MLSEVPNETASQSDDPTASVPGAQSPAASPSRPVRGRQWLARATGRFCWLYAIGAAAVFVLMRVAGERWWVATLLLFWPRWVWLAPVAVLLPLCALLQRRMGVVVILTGIIILCGIMGFRIPWRQALPQDASSQSLRVFTCNLHGTNTRVEALKAAIAQCRPDVVLLQEFPAEFEPAMLNQAGWYTDVWLDGFVASRFPIHRVKDLVPADATAQAYTAEGWPAGHVFCYAVDLPGGTIHLVNVHLASPHQALALLRDDIRAGIVPLKVNSARRTYESILVRAQLRDMGLPCVMAGDFNTTDDSPLFQRAWSDFDDAFTAAGFGFGTTYAEHHTWLRIDHILYNDGWRCTECNVRPPIGSGHRPVFANLVR